MSGDGVQVTFTADEISSMSKTLLGGHSQDDLRKASLMLAAYADSVRATTGGGERPKRPVFHHGGIVEEGKDADLTKVARFTILSCGAVERTFETYTDAYRWAKGVEDKSLLGCLMSSTVVAYFGEAPLLYDRDNHRLEVMNLDKEWEGFSK